MELTLGYDPTEDRIWLTHQTEGGFWLTRRLLTQFLPPAARMLESTTPGGEMPMAPPVHERIRMDHAEALAVVPDAPPPFIRNKPGVQPKAGDPPRKLVDTLRITHHDPQWEIALGYAGEETRLRLDRLAYHRFLAALQLTIRGAGWDLGDIPEWLVSAEKP